MNDDKKKYQLEYDAFARYIEGKPFTFKQFIVLSLKSILSLFEGLFRYIPGGIGYKLRYYYYKIVLKHLGKNVLIDVGVTITGPANVSIGDYCWIDSYCRIEAMLGNVTLGKRIHLAAFTIIGAREPVVLEDYVGVAAGAKIYSNSATPLSSKRMSGPMIPERYKAFYSKPVIIRKDAIIGANAVILPGVEIGTGAVIGANATISKNVEPYSILRVKNEIIGKRFKVKVPEL
jgi:galactoside O-acetyltransferase